MESVSQKQCTKCGKWKDRNKFSKDKTRKDGLACWCKECVEDHHKRTGFVEHVKEYNRVHAEDRKTYYLEYIQTHRELIRKRSREYYNRPENIERIRWRWVDRNNKKKANGGSIKRKEWIALCEKYGNKCLCCLRSDVKLTLDHIIPIAKGGRNSIENAQPLCGTCNSSKGTKTIDFRPF